MVFSMDKWMGKIAIITGASSGIGAAIADALVEEGLTVVGVARRSERIEKRAKQLSTKKGKLYSFKADVTKEDDVLKVFEWTKNNLGIVHVLINNAGKGAGNNLTEGKTEEWKSVLDLNVLALCTMTREAVKVMKENKINGHIIHINSIFGHRVYDIPNVNVYPASKHAITALSETLRHELKHQGLKIKVTSISPGLVESELTTLNENITPERKLYLESRAILKGEDIADGVVYVLSTPEHVQIEELTIRPIGEMF
ncbi:hypothetical protein Zmor_017643 [Zophobas morio]|uniref:Dehydrogenase/reductase SDR family member 11 n=1 Tax=Zophobas morio TaxID=2755281 RepID=A0AA38ICR2_9CUCU|nr:hypothetical protein Zmor_017643 [Zophobas morio]